MTYLARYTLQAVAVAVASLSGTGCPSSAVCSCPAPGIALFTVPAAATNPIVSVSADPPCTAMDNGSATSTSPARTAGSAAAAPC